MEEGHEVLGKQQQKPSHHQFLEIWITPKTTTRISVQELQPY